MGMGITMTEPITLAALVQSKGLLWGFVTFVGGALSTAIILGFKAGKITAEVKGEFKLLNEKIESQTAAIEGTREDIKDVHKRIDGILKQPYL